MSNLLIKNLMYYAGYESFCYQNCLRLLLEAQDIKYASLYINAALSGYMNKCSIFSELNITYHANARSLLGTYSNMVHRYYLLGENKEDIFDDNIKRIRETGQPIIVGVDTFYLPYASNYQINHAIHTAILCGYDSKENVVSLVDWYKPWLYKGSVSYDEFIYARDSENPYDGSVYSGMAIENNWAYVEKIENELSPISLLMKTLNTTIEQFYTFDSEEILFGRKIYEWIVQKISIMDIDDVELRREMNHTYIELFGMSKRYIFLYQYLSIVKNNIRENIVENMISVLDEINALWDSILVLLIKYIKKPALRTKERLCKVFNNMIEKDEMLEQEIRKLLSSSF